jgi:hypothetical protein
MTRALAFVGATSIAAVLAACSSASSDGSTPIKCGTGTTLEGGSCVADLPDSSGPGADGSSGADASAPDAGGADATTTGDADAAPLVADPCPTGTIAVNCDESCGAMGVDLCGTTTCGTQFTGYGDSRIDVFTAPVTLRTPNMPPQDNGCGCGMNTVEPVVFAMAFEINAPSANNAIEVHVGAPWWIDQITQENEQLCAYDPPEFEREQGCLTGEANGGQPILFCRLASSATLAPRIALAFPM